MLERAGSVRAGDVGSEQLQASRRRPARLTRCTETIGDQVDGVLCHLAVGRELAAVDPHDAVLADGDLMSA